MVENFLQINQFSPSTCDKPGRFLKITRIKNAKIQPEERTHQLLIVQSDFKTPLTKNAVLTNEVLYPS